MHRSARRLHTSLVVLAAVGAVAALSSCGGSDDDRAIFAFRMQGMPASEEFRVELDSPDDVARARAELALPEDERRLFVVGRVLRGPGGVNLAWHWHLEQAALAEMATEVCDGWPTFVEENLDYWVDTVQYFCPWGAYVHHEVGD